MGYRGLYLHSTDKRLHPIAAFDPARHQMMANWGTLGSYINNFIFIARRNGLCRDAWDSALESQLGYAIWSRPEVTGADARSLARHPLSP